MEKIENHKDKLTDYYKKTKTMAKLIFDCNDIEKIAPLYQHYFQLLDKMSFHNQKIVNLYEGSTKKNDMKEKIKGALLSNHRLDKYKKPHVNLEKQIQKWKDDAMVKYNQNLEWYNKGKDLRNERYVIENQMAKLKLLYNEQDQNANKIVSECIEEIDQYIIYNINNIIDFLLVINESTNMKIVSSLYRVSNIIKNIGIKSLKGKQIDFDEVYKTIETLEIDEGVSKKMDDIMEYINKRNIISNSYKNKNIENINDEKIIEYIKELKTTDEMINNNNEILKTIIEKQNEHTKSIVQIM